ncbi:hypothetical protein ACFE04_002260 [Oxalis oulophora]
MNHLTVETEDTFASLLELAANNDVDSFRRSIEQDPSGVHQAGPWYGRRKGTKQMTNEQRTPLMVAATYGSIDVIKLILSSSDADVNFSSGLDKSTALHCAASGGAVNGVDVVKLLLAAGGDPNLADANGKRPFDVIAVSPKFRDCRKMLEELLVTDYPIVLMDNSNSPPRSSSLETGSRSEKKEYPIDPTLPDIKNSIYSTDEFRMYSFKVRHCSRAYSHDWTECPFVHPGENARRRDPRKFHYSCVPCPEFRKGTCRRQDMCEYAHGVFESWLHPAQYRTRLCKDGTSCARRVCFFAHRHEELRPLYGSSMDFAAAMSLLPGSPSSVSVMSPSAFTPPGSPSTNGGPSWPQPNIPALHLPGSNFQSSRLRSSINARVIFNSESLSPRYSDQTLHASVFSPTHKSAILNQFQQQQSMLSPINTTFSPKNVDHPLLQASFGSPRSMDPISPVNSRLSLLAQREKQNLRSLSSRELGSSSAAVNSSWLKWGDSNDKPDWAVSTDELGKLRRSNSFELGNDGEEPDLSWVQSLVKESPMDMKEKLGVPVLGEGSGKNPQIESMDYAMLGAWLEQLKLDQRVVQQN